MAIKKKQEKISIPMIILGVLIIFGIGSVFGAGLIILNESPTEYHQEFGLSESDFNKLIALEYEGGFCERLGLESNVLVQDLNGTPYGVPICVAGEK